MRLAPLVLLFFVACQSTPRYMQPNGAAAQMALEVPATFDSVWQAVIETFATSTTAIETIEKVSGFVAAARPIDFAGVENLPDLVDLGVVNGTWAASLVQANPHRSSARVRFNVLVTTKDAQQVVRVNTTWSGSIAVRGADANGAAVLHQVQLLGNSTGVFERRLLESIASKLPGTTPRIVETQAFRLSVFEAPPRKAGDTREDEGWIHTGYE